MIYKFSCYYLILFLLLACSGCTVHKEKIVTDSKKMNKESIKDNLRSDVFYFDRTKVKTGKDTVITKMGFREEPTGLRVMLLNKLYYVKEGDLLLTEEELQEYNCEQEYFKEKLKDTFKIFLIYDGTEIKPSWAKGYDIKYSVFRMSFSSTENYQKVVQNMKQAALDWQNTCGVKFSYLDQFDNYNDLYSIPDDIDFDVQEADVGGEFVAVSFLPSKPKQDHILFIDKTYYDSDYDKVGVLRHELGHILGFRHEHIRSGAPAICPKEDTTHKIDLTNYDPQSVMHYFCGGVGSKELVITAFDIEGSQKIYGLPLK